MKMNGVYPGMISFLLLILFQLFYFPFYHAYRINFLKIIYLTLGKATQVAGSNIAIGNFQNCESQR